MDKKTDLEQIYVKFAELKKESDKDCHFDKNKMDESFNVTTSLSKWIRMKADCASLYRKYEVRRKKEWTTQYEFYKLDYHVTLNTKEEYSLYIESNPSYVEYYNLAMTMKEMCVFIDGTIDTLKNKQWEIKSYLEYLKFINGQ
jgi:hypothetical protein